MGQFDPGALHVPDLGGMHDPNVPSKKEQWRLIALQTVTQLALNGQINLSVSDKQAGECIVGHAKAIEKYLNNG